MDNPQETASKILQQSIRPDLTTQEQRSQVFYQSGGTVRYDPFSKRWKSVSSQPSALSSVPVQQTQTIEDLPKEEKEAIFEETVMGGYMKGVEQRLTQADILQESLTKQQEEISSAKLEFQIGDETYSKPQVLSMIQDYQTTVSNRIRAVGSHPEGTTFKVDGKVMSRNQLINLLRTQQSDLSKEFKNISVMPDEPSFIFGEAGQEMSMSKTEALKMIGEQKTKLEEFKNIGSFALSLWKGEEKGFYTQAEKPPDILSTKLEMSSINPENIKYMDLDAKAKALISVPAGFVYGFLKTGTEMGEYVATKTKQILTGDVKELVWTPIEIGYGTAQWGVSLLSPDRSVFQKAGEIYAFKTMGRTFKEAGRLTDYLKTKIEYMRMPTKYSYKVDAGELKGISIVEPDAFKVGSVSVKGGVYEALKIDKISLQESAISTEYLDLTHRPLGEFTPRIKIADTGKIELPISEIADIINRKTTTGFTGGQLGHTTLFRSVQSQAKYIELQEPPSIANRMVLFESQKTRAIVRWIEHEDFGRTARTFTGDQIDLRPLKSRGMTPLDIIAHKRDIGIMEQYGLELDYSILKKSKINYYKPSGMSAIQRELSWQKFLDSYRKGEIKFPTLEQRQFLLNLQTRGGISVLRQLEGKETGFKLLIMKPLKWKKSIQLDIKSADAGFKETMNKYWKPYRSYPKTQYDKVYGTTGEVAGIGSATFKEFGLGKMFQIQMPKLKSLLKTDAKTQQALSRRGQQKIVTKNKSMLNLDMDMKFDTKILQKSRSGYKSKTRTDMGISTKQLHILKVKFKMLQLQKQRQRQRSMLEMKTGKPVNIRVPPAIISKKDSEAFFGKRKTRSKKKGMTGKKKRREISPLADLLSVTLTEARTGKKATHLYPTGKVKAMFKGSLLRGGLRFPTAQMFRGKKGRKII